MNRLVAPTFHQAEKLNLILPQKIRLENGGNIFWQPDVKDDSVKLEISWDAGSKYQDKSLTATFTNSLLLAGSEEFTSKQIAEEIDFFGGYAQTESDKDHAEVTLYGLNENMASIFEVFQKAFEHAVFPDKELSKEREIALNKYKVNSQKVKVLGRRAFTESLFGAGTAYGQIAKEKDFRSITRDDLNSFFQSRYKKAPSIFITGNVNPSLIEELKKWLGTFIRNEHVPVQQELKQTLGRVFVEKKNAMQSAIRIGRLMFDKSHPDYFKFQLLNTILGGYFGSRLMANIREDKGYTYGVGSGLAVLQDAGYFFIATEVGEEVKEDAIAEVYKEFDLLKNQHIPDEEILKVKNYMLGEFLRRADGPIAMMEMFKNIYFNSLSETYYTDFIQDIHLTTADELQAIAQKYLNKEEMLEVVAG